MTAIDSGFSYPLLIFNLDRCCDNVPVFLVASSSVVIGMVFEDPLTDYNACAPASIRAHEGGGGEEGGKGENELPTAAVWLGLREAPGERKPLRGSARCDTNLYEMKK